MERLFVLRTAALTAMLALAGTAEAAPKTKVARVSAPKPSAPVAWCGEGTTTLPNGLCHIDGG